MIDLDQRTQLCQQIGGVYQNWLALAGDRRRAIAGRCACAAGAVFRHARREIDEFGDARFERARSFVSGMIRSVRISMARRSDT